MKINNVFTSLFVAAVLVTAIAGCKKPETVAEKGPAEKAGQQLDQAAAKAGEKLNEVANKAGQQMEKAGEKIQGAAKDAMQSNAANEASANTASKP